jgi:hypothetical protein
MNAPERVLRSTRRHQAGIAGAPRPSAGTIDLSPAIAHTLNRFEDRQQVWAESATQDAIESVRNISWWRQVRVGVRVPTNVLYFTSVRRFAQQELATFVDTHAPTIGRSLQVTPARLQRLGHALLADTVPPARMPDSQLERRWNEPELHWRRRFEQHLRAHIRSRGTTLLLDWIEDTALAIVADWNAIPTHPLVPAASLL